MPQKKKTSESSLLCRTLGGSPGLYKVVLTLARPTYLLDPEGHLSDFAGLEGDSHLAIAKPADANPDYAPDDDTRHLIFKAETDGGKFQLLGASNRRGFLGQVTAESIYGE